MNYLLDTNIILIYIRDKKTRQFIDGIFNPFDESNTPIISVVTVGEIQSIARRNRWGTAKLKLLDEILKEIVITDINSEDVIELYAEIDNFSQGKSDDKPLNNSARNMGKNDLWIAATASALGCPFLTTDKDFQHLNNVFFEVILIDIIKS